MKHTAVVLIALLTNGFGSSLFSQINDENKAYKKAFCDKLKFDTLRGNFVNEEFYTGFYELIQGPLIFFNSQNKINVKDTPSLLYKGDSVFINYCYSSERPCPEIFRKCSDLMSISFLSQLFQIGFMSKERLERYKQSKIQTKDGLNYIEFFSTLVATDLGKQKLLIPKIYSDTCGKDFEHYTCCEKEFSHVLLIVDLLDFRYRRSEKEE